MKPISSTSTPSTSMTVQRVIPKKCPLPSPSEKKPHVKNKGQFVYAVTYEELSTAHSSSQPFILISGVPGGHRDFRYLAPLLAEYAPVVRLTLPGFGVLHDLKDSPYRSIDRAQYISKVADAEEWSEFILVAHSMGGAAALPCSVLDHRITGLILVCSVGLRAHRAIRFGSWISSLLLGLSYLPLIGQALLKITRRDMIKIGFKGHPLHDDQIRLIYRHIIGLNFKELKYFADRVQQPTLCIWTDDDPLIESPVSEELAQTLQNSRSLILSSGRHNPQKEHTLEMVASMREFYQYV